MKNIKKIINDIKNKKYFPIYFLMGEETYFIDLISNFIKKNISKKNKKSFNQIILSGLNTNVNNIILYAKQLSISNKYLLIIVKDAQELSYDIEKINSYVKNPNKYTILIICYKKKILDKKKKLYNSIKKNGILFNSKKLNKENLKLFIENYINKIKLFLDEKSKLYLIKKIGNNLFQMTNELNKISLLYNKNITIDIIKNIIKKNNEKDYNYFDLEKYIIKKDIINAYKVAEYIDKNIKNFNIIFIFNMLYKLFSNIIKYKILYKIDFISTNNICNVISYIRNIDFKIKNLENKIIIEKNIFKELIFLIFKS